MIKPKFNGSDRSQVKEKKFNAQLEQDQKLTDLKEILSLKAGRRLLWRYLSECGMFRTSFDGNGSRVFFLEGMRNVGLIIHSEIVAADPEAYFLMMKEQRKDSELDGRRSNTSRAADTNTERDDE